MSAFMLAQEHLSALVTAMTRFEDWNSSEQRMRTATAWMTTLARALVLSVSHLYRDTASDEDVDAAAAAYTYSEVPWPQNGRTSPIVAARILRLCQCYRYQACEHPSWGESTAYTLIDNLQAHAQRALAASLAPDLWATDSSDVFVAVSAAPTAQQSEPSYVEINARNTPADRSMQVGEWRQLAARARAAGDTGLAAKCDVRAEALREGRVLA